MPQGLSKFDAVLVPGGGLRDDGQATPWVEVRLERALELAGADTPILTLSAGTPHKPLPRDAAGNLIFESGAGARFLEERGYDAGLIYTETCSWDTIGNAYFARMIHCDPAGWRRLAVVTSEFHMARTEAIFRWIFSLPPAESAYALQFFSTPDAGLSNDALELRRKREAASLAALDSTIRRCASLAAVHQWLFTEHTAYAIAGGRAAAAAADPKVLATY